ncbi:MAG: hypothetical protein ACLFP2_03895 [Candidatus Woesearchaeota archaeon]
MRFHYLIYPNAIDKLEVCGIKKRADDLMEEYPLFMGATTHLDIIGRKNALNEAGYYEGLPADFTEKYKKVMNSIFNEPSDNFWTITAQETIKVPCELEDMLLFTGEMAAEVLDPDEIWEYERFGFDSPSEFITTVGGYIWEAANPIKHHGYTWVRERADGSRIVNEITGDINGDLRLFQTDIASYPTCDPFESPIEMRPSTMRNIVSPYYFTEGALLVASLRYIEQEGIETKLYADKGTSFLEWGRALGQGGGSCAEHYGDFDAPPKRFFIGYDTPIPTLDAANVASDHTPHSLVTQHREFYGIYIKNGDLVLAYDDPRKGIDMRFIPEDAEEIVKGLVYQSARGLGRTSAKQLLDIIEYRFSDKFDSEIFS